MLISGRRPERHGRRIVSRTGFCETPQLVTSSGTPDPSLYRASAEANAFAPFVLLTGHYIAGRFELHVMVGLMGRYSCPSLEPYAMPQGAVASCRYQSEGKEITAHVTYNPTMS